MSTLIPLSQGLVTIIDDEDAERVLAVGGWFAHVKKGGLAYARCNVPADGGARRGVLLHTFLTGWPLVDHRNGDGLDNRRANLRRATKSQNGANQRIAARNTSGFKGVSWHKASQKWDAHIRANGRQRHLGLFLSPEEAARAYDAAARDLFGEFARPNFPEVS